MLERLGDDVLFGLLRHLLPADLSVLCRVSLRWKNDGVGGRDAVWLLLTRALSDGQGSSEMSSPSRRPRRHRRSGVQEFAAALKLRRSNAEELRARYDAEPKPGLATLRALLKRWAPLDVDYRGSAGCTLLHAVVADSRLTHGVTLRCARELVVRAKVNLNLGNDRDFSPLMSAAALGDLKTVELLLRNGADAKATGSHPNGFCGAVARPGQLPRDALGWAETFGQSSIVALIEKHNQEKQDEGTPRKRRRRRKEEEVRYCLFDCLHDRANFGEMINCETCAGWFHTGCVGVSPSEFAKYVRADANFLCPTCKAKKEQELLATPPPSPVAFEEQETPTATKSEEPLLLLETNCSVLLAAAAATDGEAPPPPPPLLRCDDDSDLPMLAFDEYDDDYDLSSSSTTALLAGSSSSSTSAGWYYS